MNEVPTNRCARPPRRRNGSWCTAQCWLRPDDEARVVPRTERVLVIAATPDGVYVVATTSLDSAGTLGTPETPGAAAARPEERRRAAHRTRAECSHCRSARGCGKKWLKSEGEIICVPVCPAWYCVVFMSTCAQRVGRRAPRVEVGAHGLDKRTYTQVVRAGLRGCRPLGTTRAPLRTTRPNAPRALARARTRARSSPVEWRPTPPPPRSSVARRPYRAGLTAA